MIGSISINIILLAGVFTSAPLRAQMDTARVEVRVVRDSAGGALLGAVRVRSGAANTRTDADGRAVLRLPAGDHWIVGSRLGFSPDSVRLIIRADTSITLVLLATSAELEGIFVSATRTERRVEDTPLRVEVVDEEEVGEKTSMRPGSIAMLLAETGGLRVQTTSPSLGGSAVRVQGLRGRYSLMLADGLPLYGGQAGGLGLLQIPPVDLARVEVIKGTASALYGSSALGGVINLVSRRPGGEAERELLVNQTSRDGTDVVGFAAAPLSEQWGFTALAGAHRQRRQDIDGDSWTDMPGYRRITVRPRIYFDDGTGRSAFLTAGYTGETREGGTVDGVAPDGAPYDERQRTHRADVGGLGRMLVGSGVLTVRGAAMEQRHEHRFGVVREDDRHRTLFGEATLTLRSGRVTPLVGVALQRESYHAADVPGFDYAYSIPAAFAQADVDVTPRITLSAAGRVDAHSDYGTFVNPRLSLLAKGPADGAWSGWTSRLSGGTGAFAPTPFTEETEVTGLAPVAPLRGLRAERARSGSLDVGGPVETSAGRVELSGTLFGSVVEHPVQVVDLPGTTTSGARRLALANASEPTHTWGGELLARLTRKPVRITGTYTYLRATEAAPGLTTRREVPLNPRHAAGIVASVEKEGQSRVALEFYYTGRQTLEHDQLRSTSRPYVLVGLLGEKRLGAVRLFVNAENLTNVRQTNDGSIVLPTRGAGGRWTTDIWAPLEGFIVNAGARLKF